MVLIFSKFLFTTLQKLLRTGKTLFFNEKSVYNYGKTVIISYI